MDTRVEGIMVSVSRRAALALALVMAGGALTRGDGHEGLAPQKVHLELRTLATGVASATFPGGARGGELAVGDSAVWSLIVRLERDRQGEPRGCRYGVSMPSVPPQEVPEEAAHAWEARLTVRSATLERIELDVDWKRYGRDADGERRVVRGDACAITLGEGERRLLDFVWMREAPGWESCYDSLALELEAKVAEDPALADRRITYDLWLVDEGRGGPSMTRRWQMVGKQGEARDFDFEPLRRSIEGVRTQALLDTRVSGSVRGRLQDDGSLEVALQAHRTDSPDGPNWALGGHGEKRVRLLPGETVRLELPAPDPDVSHEPEGSTLRRDVEGGILAGLRERTVSLVLTSRPVE